MATVSVIVIVPVAMQQELTSAFGGIADMGGLAAGTTRRE
jgi:hypothetical protein